LEAPMKKKDFICGKPDKKFHFKMIFPFLFLILGVCLRPEISFSEDIPERELDTFSVYVENDFFAGSGTDSGYTSGVKLTWSSAIRDDYPDIWPNRWFYPLIKYLPYEKSPDRRRNISISLGQNIYTPIDIESEDVVEDDRPYAGITYTSFGFHSRLNTDMDTFELVLGIIGPDSYAEQCQREIHNIFDDIQPKGWDNQLNNEPVLNLVYEHKKKITQSGNGGGFGHDLILNTGGALGNAMIFYNLGLGLRFGWNMPDDFGNYPIRPASAINTGVEAKDPRYALENKFGMYLFAMTEGRAVMHNILLDGNTFTESHSVNTKPVVGDVMGGVGMLAGPTQIYFAYVYRTKEFEHQQEPQEFGSINVSVSF
jgi:lipid A 3-O-deacylase